MKKSNIILLSLTIFWLVLIFVIFLIFRMDSYNNWREKACFTTSKDVFQIKSIVINTKYTQPNIIIWRKKNDNIIEIPEMKKHAKDYMNYKIVKDSLIINLESKPGFFKGDVNIYLPNFEYIKARNCILYFVEWSKNDICQKLTLDFFEVFNNYYLSTPNETVNVENLNLNMKYCNYKIFCNDIIKNTEISLVQSTLNLGINKGILNGRIIDNSELNINKSDSLKNNIIKDSTSKININ